MGLIKTNEKQWLIQLNQYLIENIEQSHLTVDEIAIHFGVSRRQFYRKVKSLTNQTPHAYLNQIRFKAAYKLLEEGTYETIAETAKAVGYNDTVYFARKFKKRFGMLPSEIK